MALTITRTPQIDDDGTGTTGTIWNNAWKTELYNQIDAVLAKADTEASGNFLVKGNLTVNGTITAVGLGKMFGLALGVTNPGANPGELRAESVVVTGGQLQVGGMTAGVGAANVYYNGGDWRFYVASSARRLKREIRPLDADLARVLALAPRVFKSRLPADGDGDIPGFIAEEVAAVFPEAVEMDATGEPAAVRYDRMAAYLLVAIRELAGRVASLEGA